MKKYLILFLLLFSVPIIKVNALNINNEIEIVKDGNYGIKSMTKVGDYYYGLVSTDSKEYFSDSKDYGLVLIKFDKSNKIVWSKKLDKLNSLEYSLIKSFDNKLFITSKYLNTLSASYSTPIILVYDIEGNFLHENKFFDTKSYIFDIAFYNNHYYLLFTNDQDDTNNLVKISSYYNVLENKKIYKNNSREVSIDFFIYNNKLFLLENYLIEKSSKLLVYDLSSYDIEIKNSKSFDYHISTIYVNNEGIYLSGMKKNNAIFLKISNNLNVEWENINKTSTKYNDVYHKIIPYNKGFKLLGSSSRDNGWFLQKISGANIDNFIIYDMYDNNGKNLEKHEMLLPSSNKNIEYDNNFIFTEKSDSYLVLNFDSNSKNKASVKAGLLDINLKSPTNFRLKTIISSLFKYSLIAILGYVTIKFLNKKSKKTI